LASFVRTNSFGAGAGAPHNKFAEAYDFFKKKIVSYVITTEIQEPQSLRHQEQRYYQIR